MNISDRATAILEEKRRRWAISFYDNFSQFVSGYETKLRALKSSLDSLRQHALGDLAKRQHNAIAPSPFHIYLHGDALQAISVTLTPADIAQFKNHIGEVVNLMGCDESLLRDKLFAFAKKHQQVQEALNTTIDDVLSKMNAEQLKSVLARLISLAEPLWVTNTMGYQQTTPNMDKFLIIGVYQKGTSFLESITDASTKDILTLPNHTTAYVTTQRTDRISVLMVQDLLPIYAVANVPVYKADYESRESRVGGIPIAYYLDSNLDARIKSEQFDLFPTEEQNNFLELWVLGFVFGHIHYDVENGQYWVRSLDRGNALQNYRFNLGSQRDVAYDTFQSMSIGEEMQSLIDNMINEEGINGYLTKIRDAKNGDYLQTYSQISQSELSQIEKPAYSKIKQLITDEINFITRFKITDNGR